MPPDNKPDDDSVPEIRKKLEKALRDLEAVTGERDQLKQTTMLHTAGLTHLTEQGSERKLRALLNSFDKDEEVTVDSLKTAAKDLGYEATTSTPAPDPNTPPSDTPPGTPPADTEDDTAAQASITGLSDAEMAHIMGLRGVTTGDLNEAMGKANSKEELLAALKTHGPKSGIILDTEID